MRGHRAQAAADPLSPPTPHPLPACGRTGTQDQAQHRFAAPEALQAMALAPSGRWIAGAAATGRAYLWQAATGHLLRVWDAHYGAVTRLAFTEDDAVVISAGDDATVRAWALAKCVPPPRLHTQCAASPSHGPVRTSVRLGVRPYSLVALRAHMAPAPLYTWRDHTLPVTDVAVGAGGGRGWVATCSVDQTCKVIPARPALEWRWGSGRPLPTHARARLTAPPGWS